MGRLCNFNRQYGIRSKDSQVAWPSSDMSLANKRTFFISLVLSLRTTSSFIYNRRNQLKMREKSREKSAVHSSQIQLTTISFVV